MAQLICDAAQMNKRAADSPIFFAAAIFPGKIRTSVNAGTRAPSLGMINASHYRGDGAKCVYGPRPDAPVCYAKSTDI